MDQGLVEEAIRALAVLEGDTDLEAVVARVRKDVEDEMRACFPEPQCMDDCARDIVQTSADFRRAYGPWSIAVLIQCLERQDPQIPAFSLLRECDDIVPCLTRALGHGSPALRNEACSLLHAMVFLDGRSVNATPTLTEALRALADDPAGDPGTRMRSRNLLDRLPPVSDGCPKP